MYRLTIPQQNIWDLQKTYSDTSISNLCGAVFFDRHIEKQTVEQALNMIIEHQSGMRLRFKEGNDGVEQYIAEYSYTSFLFQSFDNIESLDRYAEAFARKPFEMTGSAMYRFIIFELNGNTGILACLNHMIADAWSMSLLAKDVTAYCKEIESGISSANETHSYIDFVESEAKGLLYVNTTNDKFYSSFRLSAPDLSDELSCEDAETAFGYYDDVPILISNEKFYNSDSGAEITSVNDVSDEVLTDRINQTAITITKKSVRKAKRSAPNSSFSCSLDVTPVSNTSINGNGGICWAASIAAKHNYEYGNTPDMDEYVDATEVFYTVAGCTGNSNPTGTPQNTKLGLACFGLYNTYKAGALNINQVYQELLHDNPIIISVAAPRFAHSLVLCGVTYNGTTGTYTFADSNFSSSLTIFVDSDAVDGSNFIYTSDTITGAYNSHFRNWYQTYSYHYES